MTVRADVLRRELRAAYRASLVACTFEAARELLRERPKNALARFRLGGALADFARYAEALRMLRPLLRRGAPHRDLVHWCLADLHERRGMLPRAMHHLRCAIRIEPQEAGWHIRLGGLLARSGRHRAAENAHRRATRCARGPRDEAFLNLGLVLRARGKYRNAKACFLRAIALDPNYREARHALRDVERAISRGDRSAAEPRRSVRGRSAPTGAKRKLTRRGTRRRR